MSKIAEMTVMMDEIGKNRELSPTAQRMIKAANQLSSQQGSNLISKLRGIATDLKQVKSEAKGLDHKTATKLDKAISDLTNLAFYVDKHGLKAVESNED